MKPSERVLRLLTDYAPLPLTYDDLQDELGVERGNIQQVVNRLVRKGLVQRDGGKGQRDVLIRLPGRNP